MAETPEFVQIRKNLVHFPSLSPGLRLLTGLGIAQVVVSVLLLAAQGLDLAGVPAVMSDGQLEVIAWPFLFLECLLLVGGWTYLLSGALQARWWLTFLVLALATLALWEPITISTSQPFGPLAAAALWLYALLRKTALRRLSLAFDLGVSGSILLVLHLASAALALLHHDATALLGFSLGIGGQVMPLLALLIPMLVVAGVDLAEISAEAGAWVTAQVLDAIPLRAALAGMLALAALKVGFQVHAGLTVAVLLRNSLPAALAIGGGVALLIFWLRQSERELEAPAFGLLLVLSYLLFAIFILAIVVVDVSSTTQSRAVQAASNMNIQRNWALAGLVALGAGGAFLFRTWRRHRHIAGSFLFLLVYGVWVLVSIGNPLALLPALGKDKLIDPVLTLPSLDVAVSLAAAFALAALAGLRRLDRAAAGYVASALVGLSLLEAINGLYAHQLSATDLLSLGQVALFLALVGAGLVRLRRQPSASARSRRLALGGLAVLTPLFAATLAVIVGDTMHALPAGLALPEEGVSAVVLAIALCWDLLMSGGRFTNGHSDRFPRHGRLLLYLGYISLAAGALLWTKTLHPAGDLHASGEGFFNPDILPPYGIAVLGIPLLIYLWALAGHRLWNAAPAPAE